MGGSTRIVAPEAKAYASPARGLLFSVSPALPALWELGATAQLSSAPVHLTRALWHRHEPAEPLRATRNRSLPGAYLAEDRRLQGHLFGLALSGASREQTVEALRLLGVNKLARSAKVSLARFSRVVETIRAGLPAAAPGSSDAGADGGTGHAWPPTLCTATVCLGFLWSTARSKACLLEFFEAAAEHLPRGTLLGDEYDATCASWRAEWLAASFDRDALDAVDDIQGTTASTAAVKLLASLVEDEATLEMITFALAGRGSERPEVEQARHSFRGQAAVPDCVEAILRDTLSLLLWDFSRGGFDGARLPRSADRLVRDFFSSSNAYSSGSRAGSVWFDICSARRRVQGRGGGGGGRTGTGTGSPSTALHYISGSDGLVNKYELHPSLRCFLDALESLLGMELEAPPPSTDGAFLPLWPGALLAWSCSQSDSDRPVLRLRPTTTTTASGATGAAAPKSPPHSSRPPARTEELRLVFKSGVHCYALRQAVQDEPRWIAGVRRAWMHAWREGGALSLNGRDHELVATILLGRGMLLASSHRLPQPESASTSVTAPTRGSRFDAPSALLATMSAGPYGYEERLAGLRLLYQSGPAAWWALPLLLQPPVATGQWDSLTLGSCAELLEPALRLDRSGRTSHAEGARQHPQALSTVCVDAAGPALQAVLALQSSKSGALRDALGRCSAAERWIVMEIAVGHSGFSFAQRISAVVAGSGAWWEAMRRTHRTE
jgi:hypothetical protein